MRDTPLTLIPAKAGTHGCANAALVGLADGRVPASAGMTTKAGNIRHG